MAHDRAACRKIEIDSAAQRFLDEALLSDHDGVVRIIANDPDAGDVAEYQTEHRAACEDHLIAADAPVNFLEIYVIDASDSRRICRPRCRSGATPGSARPERRSAKYNRRVLAPPADHTGKIPHAYFNWSEGNPLLYLIRYVLSGQGDVAPLTREILRQAEADPERRPQFTPVCED